MSYLLTQGGQQYGPYEVDALRQMLVAGQITQADLIWTQGMPAWAPIFQVFPASVPVAPAPPVYAAPVAPAAGTGPVPPGMHWAVVMVLAGLTLGLFAIIWAFVEASFIKKISPRRNGRGLLFAILLINVIYLGAFFLAYYDYHGGHGYWNRLSNIEPEIVMPSMGYLLAPVLWILGIVAIFRMRRGLLNYYNSTEPIQLRLGAFMTFFFSIYYFPHHLQRIAKWKQTGQLAPQ